MRVCARARVRMRGGDECVRAYVLVRLLERVCVFWCVSL